MIQYIEIEDGSELWDNVRSQVVKSVTVEEFDLLVDSGVIDLDGKLLVNLESLDD